jgi:hypothetical protein
MKKILLITIKIIGLTFLMALVYTISSAIFAGSAAEATSTDDAQNALLGIILVSFVDVIILSAIVLLTDWYGMKLVLGLTIAFFGVQTFIGQIEALAFLTPLAEYIGGGSVPILEMPADLILGMFVTGFILAVIVIPVTVVIFGRFRKKKQEISMKILPQLPLSEWLLKVAAVIVIYELLYFGFGYFVAWQSEAVRSFYQSESISSGFFDQLATVVTQTPLLFLLQAVRAILWVLLVLPVIMMLKNKGIWGALVTALFVSLPMNIGHIIPNAFMPADVRMMHFIETASSNFIFGLILFWLFQRSHNSIGDLFSKKDETLSVVNQ